MNENLKAFWEGAVEGAKETPRGFFAPVTAFIAWLDRVTDEALEHSSENRPAADGHKERK